MVLKLAVVNDYEIVVRGLAAMMRSYADSVEVVELAANKPVKEPVDIALYDTFATTNNDFADLKDLLDNDQVNRVVVYSWEDDPELAKIAMQQGASGYFSKSMTAHQLVDALRTVHSGGTVISPTVDPDDRGNHTPPRARVTGGDWPGREEGLTVRESEVLALITQGLSNVDIAERTRLSINSVKSYIRSCYRKIDVTTRSQAVLWGVEHGFRPDIVRVVDPPTVS